MYIYIIRLRKRISYDIYDQTAIRITRYIRTGALGLTITQSFQLFVLQVLASTQVISAFGAPGTREYSVISAFGAPGTREY